MKLNCGQLIKFGRQFNLHRDGHLSHSNFNCNKKKTESLKKKTKIIFHAIHGARISNLIKEKFLSENPFGI